MAESPVASESAKCSDGGCPDVPGKGEAVLALPGQYRVDPCPLLTEEVNQLFGHAVVESVLEGE